jgi:hypothetical protein
MRTPDGNAFTGDLQGRKRCVRNRNVTIIGPGGGAIGSVRSSQSGEFELIVDGVEDGDYFAKARRRVRRPGDHKHKCRGGRSPAISVAGSCSLILTGGPSAAEGLTVDDDLTLLLDGSPIFTDNDEMADNHPPIVLGVITEGGEELRVIASNSTEFGGPMSLDPLWIHCLSQSVSFALDPEGFSAGSGDLGEIFYDETFVVPDIVP